MPDLVLPGLVCPCGAAAPLTSCCGRVHDDLSKASRAEEVMRARYTAFATGNATFLRASWDTTTRPADVGLDPATRWTGLEIIEAVDGGPDDATGIVEFRARFTSNGTPGVIHERSRFRRSDGAWRYLDGDHG